MLAKTFSLAFLIGALTHSASAAVYFFNFGNGNNAANVPTSDAEKQRNPYNAEHPSFGVPTWNNLITADVASGLVDSTGASSSLGVNLGVGSASGSTTINLGVQPTGHGALTGAAISTGVYEGNSVGRYGIFANGSAIGPTNQVAIGLQLSGLAAGTYEIYSLSRNTNITGAYSFTTYVGTSTTAGNFDFSGYSSETISYTNGEPTASWVDNGNYQKTTVTIGAGEYLNIAVAGTPDGQSRGFLNGLIIAAVPEPSSALMVLGAGFVGVLRRRRK